MHSGGQIDFWFEFASTYSYLTVARVEEVLADAGVDHVEASTELLEKMLTLRIHLDDVTDDNGPLQVIPGSHVTGKSAGRYELAPTKILCHVGDVLAMRPLVSHASAHSTPGLEMHRRILHLEFAGVDHLRDGFQWHQFKRLFRAA